MNVVKGMTQKEWTEAAFRAFQKIDPVMGALAKETDDYWADTMNTAVTAPIPYTDLLVALQTFDDGRTNAVIDYEDENRRSGWVYLHDVVHPDPFVALCLVMAQYQKKLREENKPKPPKLKFTPPTPDQVAWAKQVIRNHKKAKKLAKES